MNRVFIGYDPRQVVSYTVLQHSIIANTNSPVTISPLKIEAMPIKRQGLTPFTFSRFLVPWLCGYRGWALFLDADMLVKGDVNELFQMADDRYDVMVVKNVKKFEWASVMLFNNAKCKMLTPEFIETAPKLHDCSWSESIGELPAEWNHLVGYDEPKEAKLIHYTQGVPAFPQTDNTEYAEEWKKVGEQAMATLPWEVLMGRSIHAQPVIDRLVREGKIDLAKKTVDEVMRLYAA